MSNQEKQYADKFSRYFSSGEKNLYLSVHCEAKRVGWEQLSFIHKNKQQAGFWKISQTQNIPEKNTL